MNASDSESPRTGPGPSGFLWLAATVVAIAPSGWAQCDGYRLTSSGLESEDYFGWSASNTENTTLVGADRDNIQVGAVYVFERQGIDWVETEMLVPSVSWPGQRFGHSVAMSPDRAVIGSPDDPGGGSVYLFERVGSHWMESTKLNAQGAPFDDFGRCVALDGNRVAIGAPGENSSRGAAYVFEIQGTAWLQVTRLTASDGADNERFGSAVQLAGGTALVGAPDDNGGRGAAYVFEESGTSWNEVQKLTSSDSAPSDYFGLSFCMEDDTLILGAFGDDDLGALSGSAYVFENTTSGWVERHKLTASDGSAGDNFGISVCLDGHDAVIGAKQAGNSGAAYVFSRTSLGWMETTRLETTEPTALGFGHFVSMHASTVIVTDPWDTGSGATSGAAYAFTLETGSSYCSGTPNSTGSPASMSAGGCGNPSIAANNLVLRAEPVPDQFFVFFFGANQAQIPFGNGFLCIGGALTRIQPPVQADMNSARRHVDLPTVGITTPGTVNFQCWYRDPVAGGSLFNTSNGLSVTFVP